MITHQAYDNRPCHKQSAGYPAKNARRSSPTLCMVQECLYYGTTPQD